MESSDDYIELLADGARYAAKEDWHKYRELLADGARHASKEDWQSASRSCREAIALRPDEPTGYYNLDVTLGSSRRIVGAAQLFLEFLEAKERFQADSKNWAVATADAFEIMRLQECGEAGGQFFEVALPEWWNDEELKALSVRVVRAAPNDWAANTMRAHVLSGKSGAWEAGPRSAAELSEAAKHLAIERLRLACCSLPSSEYV